MPEDGLRFTVLIPVAGGKLEPICGFQPQVERCTSLLRTLLETDDRVRRADPAEILVVACNDRAEILPGTRLAHFFQRDLLTPHIFEDLVKSNRALVMGTGAALLQGTAR